MKNPTKRLLDPIKMGDWDLPNRMIMAPLTRCRASEGRVPNALMAQYYAQRATAGLIISEATCISPMAVGYPDTPGIWTEAQVEGWKLVTEAVHAAGGRIVCQLWHVGRISDPHYLDGALPVAPSAIAPRGMVSYIRPKKKFVTPRALETHEVAETVRTDIYGGPVENRARFMLEAVDAAISVFGPGKVGLHIAPGCDASDMGDSDPAGTFGYVAAECRKRGIAFLFAREGQEEPRLAPGLKKIFAGPFIANQALSLEEGESLLAAGDADAVSWGRPFIANPDLVKRHAEDAPLNDPDPDTFGGIGHGPKGYIDYPFLGE
jgi:2,4-dienoyl-CoA reductase-like NADH-dependent reductase (Old Yellow Enzyme family)